MAKMAMKKKLTDYEDDSNDYEYYEERKKIKRVDSEHHRRREIRNWKKVWSEHTNDYDEVDEFYGQR
jgi:hypothetical protein